MDFSVVVPCFNSEAYLERCLKALSTQTWPRSEYELIFVDNNSTDGSLKIARSFAAVTVLEEAFQSSYAARNLGVRHSSGRLIAFTDPDCEVGPTWLETMASAFTRPGTAVALGDVRFARESFCLTMAADYEMQKARYVWGGRGVRLGYVYTNNMAVRREVFEKCGPFDHLKRGADVVFSSRVVNTYGAESVRYVPNRISHLEINHLSDWLKKLSTYGRSYAGYHRLSHTKALTLRDRIEVMGQTIACNKYSAVRALSLAGLLALGCARYDFSRLVHSIQKGTWPIVF
jgi:glycosyltransferase involved in cell wall biosynthesis